LNKNHSGKAIFRKELEMVKKLILLLSLLIVVLFLIKFIIYKNERKKLAPNVQIGELAPDFAVIDSKDDSLQLSELKGKYVLLDFWSTSCVPCREDLPKLKQIYSHYSNEDLILIGISNDSKKEIFLKYIQENQIAWKQVLDELENKGIVNQLYKVKGFPTYILIDREGKVVDWKISKVPKIPL